MNASPIPNVVAPRGNTYQVLANSVMLLTWLMFFLIPRCASAQDITLRLLDSRSGKPLRKVPVTAFVWNGPATFRPDDIPEDEIVLHEVTDAGGQIIFHVPERRFAHIGFSVGTPVDFAGCWHLGEVSPEKIVQSGLVADYDELRCGRSKVQVSAKPSEVVILERRLSAGEKIRRELPGGR